MAITGKFAADFADFYAAVDKADAKLADFQSGAGRVETSLNKMVDSFSGRKMIQEATLAAEAIERIGGVSKLTQSELHSVAAQATEALEKLKAMGVDTPPGIQKIATQAADAAAKLKAIGTDAPPGIQKVATELRPVSEELRGVDALAARVGPQIVAAFAIGSIVRFASEIGKAQQQLSRLSVETQIGVGDLQTLTDATAGYGLSNEELAKALFQVSKGIAGGDESVARGLHQAGLSLNELRDKHGVELFLEIERGVAKLQGSLRDTAAADIFGIKLGASMAGFAKEADGAIAAAGRLNTQLSAKEVEQLKRYADEIEHVELNLGRLKDKTLVGSIDLIHNLGLKFREGAASALDFFAALAGKEGGNLAALHENIAKAADEQARLTTGVKEEINERSKESQALQYLATLRVDAAKQLENYQLRGLEELRSLGQLNQQNAAAIFVSVDQFKKYTEEVRAGEAATKALTSATIDQGAQLSKLHSQLQDQLVRQRGTQTEIELANIKTAENAEILSVQRRADALKASLEASHADTKENFAQIDKDAADATKNIKGSFDKLREGVGLNFDLIRTKSLDYYRDLADRELKTYNDMIAHADQYTKGKLDAQLQKYREAAFAATAMGQQAVDAQDAAAAAASRHNAELDKQVHILEEIAAQEKIKTGMYTIGPDGKAVAVNSITRDVVGKVTPVSEREAQDAAALERQINKLTKALAEYAPPPFQPGSGLNSFIDGQRAQLAAAQQHANDQQQLDYLKTLLSLLTSGGGGGGRVIPFAPGGGSGGRGWDPPPNVSVQVMVSGVMDMATIAQIGEGVSDRIMTKLKIARQFGAN